MKYLLLSFLLTLSLASAAQAVHPRHQPAGWRTATPKVYVCGGGAAYAYHSRDGCAGLNRCSHEVSAVTIEAEAMERCPCKKCY